jgi:hypothetical protein
LETLVEFPTTPGEAIDVQQRADSGTKSGLKHATLEGHKNQTNQ